MKNIHTLCSSYEIEKNKGKISDMIDFFVDCFSEFTSDEKKEILKILEDSNAVERLFVIKKNKVRVDIVRAINKIKVTALHSLWDKHPIYQKLESNFIWILEDIGKKIGKKNSSQKQLLWEEEIEGKNILSLLKQAKHIKDSIAFTQQDQYSYTTQKVNFNSIKKEDLVNILFGPCMFWSEWIQMKGENGWSYYPVDPYWKQINEKIVTVIADKKLSEYQIDQINRIVKHTTRHINPEGINKVVLQIPRVQYYNYAINDYNKWLIDKGTMREYFSIIDKRSNKIEEKYREEIIKNLWNISVERNELLSEIDEYLYQKIGNWNKVSTQEIKRILLASHRYIFWKNNLFHTLSDTADIQDIWLKSYIAWPLEASAKNPLLVFQDTKEMKALKLTISKIVNEWLVDHKIVWIYSKSQQKDINREIWRPDHLYFKKR